MVELLISPERAKSQDLPIAHHERFAPAVNLVFQLRHFVDRRIFVQIDDENC